MMLSRRTALTGAAVTAATVLPPSAWAQESFAGFVAGMKAEARAKGVPPAILERAFQGVQPNAKVIELDRFQPESTMTWPKYRALVLPDTRLAAARAQYTSEQALLGRVWERYRVEPRVIVAIWGIESGFGANTGKYNVVEALATLAWEGRRASFFRGELLAALQILGNGDITPDRMTGAWAGAMGQPQFMPSSYLRTAVDFDGDGRRDIWNSRADVFGSIANYLAKSGWQGREPWGQAVLLPVNFDVSAAGRDRKRSLTEWMRLGVRRADGSAFTRGDVTGAVVLPDKTGGEAFMTYANYAAIRRYNQSDYYCCAVGLLADSQA